MSGDGNEGSGREQDNDVEPDADVGAGDAGGGEGVAEMAAGAVGHKGFLLKGLSPTVSLTAFVLGLLAGIPLAIFGLDTLLEMASPIFGFLFFLFIIFVLIAALVVVFRSAIWDRLFRIGQVEVDKFASPLSRAARNVAEQRVGDAADDLREFAEMVLSRYSWLATRRWLLATATGFIAAIAALAASALLFQQNELLAVQNQRLSDQTALLETQIELGEASRSLSIVPEILDIGGALGVEAAALAEQGHGTSADHMLSPGLRSRIIAATNAVRPYRYLAATAQSFTDADISYSALARRTDLGTTQEALEIWRQNQEALYGARQGATQLIDRAVSPERGQIISLLFNNLVLETEHLTFNGADFSFAEVRQPNLAVMSFQHAVLRFADFSTSSITQMEFGAAYLEGSRFRTSSISGTSFSSVPDSEVKEPLRPSGEIDIWRTSMTGADFTGATIRNTKFEDVNGLAMIFDGAILSDVSFARSSLGASTFRHAVVGEVNFLGTSLKGVDFDGALVFDENFIEDLKKSAEPDSFVPERFAMRPATTAEVAAHPRGAELWQLGALGEGQAYIVERVGEFD
jgi:uncharacterized protein YjbI with pentapeptide repeats